MKKSALLCTLVLSSLATAPFVQAEEFLLDKVVVTATRTTENIARVPAAVSVITAEEIKQRPAQNISDILATLPAAYQSPTSDGGLSIRGFDSTEMLVLLDNQPLNSGWNGSVDWQSLPTDNIERIEIVRGAASSLYGGRAVGAVINIITKKSTDDFSGVAQYSYGSNNTKHASVHMQGKNEHWRLGIGYENRSTDGYRNFFVEKTALKENSATADYSASLPTSARGRYIVGGRGQKASDTEIYQFQLGYAWDDQRHVDYQYTHSTRDYVYNHPFSFVRDKKGNPVYYGIVQLQNGKQVEIYPDDFLGYVGENEMDIHRLSYTDEEHQIAGHLGYTHYKKQGYSSAGEIETAMSAAELQAWNGPGGYSFYPSKTWDFDLHKTWQSRRHTLTAGINYQREEFEQTRYDALHWRDHKNGLSPYEYNGGRGTTWALYVQDQFHINDNISLYVGTRFDRYRKSNGYQRVLKKDQWQSTEHGEATYTEWSPKFAIEYTISDADSIYLSYGHSFNPPILYKVYRSSSSTIPNPQLKPETSNTWELGWKHRNADFTWNLSAFQAKTDNLIVYQTISKKPRITQYVNAASTTTRKGIELEANYQFNPHWSSYINYTWQQEKEDSEVYFTTPKHLLHLGIAYQYKKWNALLDATYASARQSPNSISGVYQSEDAYFITNLTANYQVTKELSLQGQVYNLFNRHFFAGEAARDRAYQLSLRYQF